MSGCTISEECVNTKAEPVFIMSAAEKSEEFGLEDGNRMRGGDDDGCKDHDDVPCKDVDTACKDDGVDAVSDNYNVDAISKDGIDAGYEDDNVDGKRKDVDSGSKDDDNIDAGYKDDNDDDKRKDLDSGSKDDDGIDVEYKGSDVDAACKNNDDIECANNETSVDISALTSPTGCEGNACVADNDTIELDMSVDDETEIVEKGTILAHTNNVSLTSENKDMRVVITPLEEFENRGDGYKCGASAQTSNCVYRPFKNTIRIYECPTCAEMFNSIGDLDIHTKIHDAEEAIDPEILLGIAKCIKTSLKEMEKGDKKYKCSHCNYMSDCSSNVHKHVKRLHSKTLKCYKCDYFTYSQKDFGRHIDKVHSQATTTATWNNKVVKIVNTPEELIRKGKKTYMCSECGITFNNVGFVYTHIGKRHIGYTVHNAVNSGQSIPCQTNYCKKSDQIETENCDMSKTNEKAIAVDGSKSERYQNEDSIAKAVDSVSVEVKKGQQRFKCPGCGRYALSRSALYRHMKRKHRESLSLETSAHARSIESVENPQVENDLHNRVDNAESTSAMSNHACYECCICMKTFRTGHDLDKHVETHKPITKRKRGENNFGSKRSIKSVKILKTPKKDIEKGIKLYRCSLCNQSSDSINDMDTHVKRNHKGFTLHLGSDIIQSKRKKYKCSECGKQSNFLHSMRDHLKEKHIGCAVKIIRRRPFTNQSVKKDSEPILRGKKGIKVDKLRTSLPNAFEGIAPESFECCVCMKTFGSCGDLDKHIETHHKTPTEKFSGRDDADSNVTCADNIAEDCSEHEELEDAGEQSDWETNETDLDIEKKEIEVAPERSDIEDMTSTCNDNKVVRVIKASSKEIQGGERPYKCSACTHRTNGLANMYSHMRRIHKRYIIKNLEGEIVDAIPNHYNTYRQNVISTSSNKIVKVIKTPREDVKRGEAPYRCSECDYVSFSGLANLYNHMRTVHQGYIIKNAKGQIVDKIISDNCKKIVKVVRTPSKDVKKGEKAYKCSACDHSTNAVSNMYKHMRTVHKGCTLINAKGDRINSLVVQDDSFFAAYGKSSGNGTENKNEDSEDDNVMSINLDGSNEDDTESGLQIRTQSDEEESYDDSVPPGTNIVYDIRLPPDSNGERLFKCSECGYKSIHRGNLNKHMRRKHPLMKIVRTPIKMKKPVPLTSNGTVYDVELPRDSSINNQRVFKCSECEYKSVHRGNLTKHMRRRHGGMKIIRTPIKMIRPIRNSNVKEENENAEQSNKIVYDIRLPRDSKGQRPFKCSECDYKTVHRANLKLHMKRKHRRMKIMLTPLTTRKYTSTSTCEIASEKEPCNDQNSLLDSTRSSISPNKTATEKEIGCTTTENQPCNDSNLFVNSTTSSNISPNKTTTEKEMGSTAAIENDVQSSQSNHFIVFDIELPRGPNGLRLFKCSECDYVQDHRGALTKHMKRKHKEFSILRTTIKYDRPAPSQVNKHDRKRKPIRNGFNFYKCSHCNYSTNHLKMIDKHMKRKHSNTTTTSSSSNPNKVHENSQAVIHKNKNALHQNEIKIIKFPGEMTEKGKKARSKYKCSVCGVILFHVALMCSHIKDVHLDHTSLQQGKYLIGVEAVDQRPPDANTTLNTQSSTDHI